MSTIVKTKTIAQDQPGGCVDAVLNLGSACQVASVLFQYGLHEINSPFHGFGFNHWRTIIPILANRFADYWQLENMKIMRVAEARAFRSYDPESKYYGQTSKMLEVFCRKYHAMGKYNFILEENSINELKTYPQFHKGLQTQEDIFLKQCALYDDIRFICKAVSAGAPQKTNVKEDDVLALLDVLRELRGGKAFTLALAVPAQQYASLKSWVIENQIPNLHIAPWKILWNHENHDENKQEWDALLCGVTIPENYRHRLVHEIIGDPSVELIRLNTF